MANSTAETHTKKRMLVHYASHDTGKVESDNVLMQQGNGFLFYRMIRTKRIRKPRKALMTML